ncbi:MAG: hypothetical protein R2940_13215 [Syntrophotaleaceae bacterium]
MDIHEKGFLEAIAALKKDGVLVTPQSIQKQLNLKRGALKDIEKFLLKRERKRDEAIEMRLPEFSEEFALDFSLEINRIVKIRTIPLEKKCEEKDEEIAALKTELAATRDTAESLKVQLTKERELSKQERERALIEEGKLQGQLEAAQQTNRDQAQALSNLRQPSLSEPMLASLQDTLQKVANALEENNQQQASIPGRNKSEKTRKKNAFSEAGEPNRQRAPEEFLNKENPSTPGPAPNQVTRERATGNREPGFSLPP